MICMEEATQCLGSWQIAKESSSVSTLTTADYPQQKTVICPVTTTVLGWVWSSGSIHVSDNKINPLVSCEKPTTVRELRSWVGAYKHIESCTPKHSALLSDLVAAVAGQDSKQHSTWSENPIKAFADAQSALKDPKTITIPRTSDQLIITKDGVVHIGGVVSVLYILRGKNKCYWVDSTMWNSWNTNKAPKCFHARLKPWL